MTLAILISAAILTSAGYIFARSEFRAGRIRLVRDQAPSLKK
jgi:hypothetical protein